MTDLATIAPGALAFTTSPEAAQATGGWLLSLTARTRVTYQRNLAAWFKFCESVEVQPLEARRAHVDAWIATQRYLGAAPASIANRIASVSAWYNYLLSDEAVDRNPCAAVKRPKVERDESSTAGLTRDQVRAFEEAIENDTDPRVAKDRNRAVFALMLLNGLRCGEVIGANLDDLGALRGHRVLRVEGKGGKVHQVPMAAPTAYAIDRWIGLRGDAPGPLFHTAAGRRLDPKAVFKMIRRYAAMAGPDVAIVAARISPHSLRHTAITGVLDAGASLRDAQDFARHADPRTTRGYDRNRHALDGHATYRLAAWLDRSA